MRILKRSDNIGDEVEERGMAIIKGMDIAKPDEALLQLLSEFSIPTSYGKQPMIMDIKPRDGAYPASSAGTGFFDLHTDMTFTPEPPTHLAMICLSVDDEGGDSLLADGQKAAERLSPKNRRLLLEERIAFPSPKHVSTPDIFAPVLHRIAEETAIRVRFHSGILESDQQRMHATLRRAVEQFYNNAKELLMTIRLEPGQALVLDNQRFLHGRTEVKSGESRRHLKRAYGVRQ